MATFLAVMTPNIVPAPPPTIIHENTIGDISLFAIALINTPRTARNIANDAKRFASRAVLTFESPLIPNARRRIAMSLSV